MPSRDFMVNRQLPWIEPCIYLKPPELSLAHQEALKARDFLPFPEGDIKKFGKQCGTEPSFLVLIERALQRRGRGGETSPRYSARCLAISLPMGRLPFSISEIWSDLTPIMAANCPWVSSCLKDRLDPLATDHVQ
jgi:hypothetical protein